MGTLPDAAIISRANSGKWVSLTHYPIQLALDTGRRGVHLFVLDAALPAHGAAECGERIGGNSLRHYEHEPTARALEALVVG